MAEAARLAGWPGPVLRLTQARSTQDLAKAMAREGAPEWSLVIAERQSRGRGRLGRRWASPKGGLYLSAILRPRISPERLGELSLAAAEAAARALAAVSGIETAVKPPNDVLARPRSASLPWKKVCGILIEASGGPDGTDWLVLGLGLNVNNRVPAGLPDAGSLRGLCGREIALEPVEARILAEIRSAYRSFLGRREAENLRPIGAEGSRLKQRESRF